MANLDESGKSRYPHRDSIPRPSSLLEVAIPTELFRPTVMTNVVSKLLTYEYVKECCKGYCVRELDFADFPVATLSAAS